MNPTLLRTVFRWLHIAFALAVGAYLYSPWAQNPAFAALIKLGLFPLTGFMGLAMWQQARLSRIFSKNHPERSHG